MYDTHELPSEEAARGHRKVAAAAKKPGNTSENVKEPAKITRKAWHRKAFNLSTYKVHALGDYAQAIQTFGMTDGYTTQVVSRHAQMYCQGEWIAACEHCSV